jgi:IS5 family transposase
MGARAYEDMTVLHRLRREDEEDEAYREAYEQIECEQRAEWAEQFGSIPYKPNGNDIHRLAMAKLHNEN